MADIVLLPKPTKAPEPPKEWEDARAFLTALLADIEAGKVDPEKMMLFWSETLPNGRNVPHYWIMGLNNTEQIAYGQLVIQSAIEDWRQ